MTQFRRLSHCSAALFVALVVSTLAASSLLSGRSAAQSGGVEGVWIDHTGRGAVQIARCGSAICGNIVWLQQPNDDKGRPLQDANNPNANQRSRPICGLPVIGDAKPTSTSVYDGGWIYDPEDGKRYSVEVKLISPNVLTVTGYVGIKMLGETYTWKRAPAGQAKCARA